MRIFRYIGALFVSLWRFVAPAPIQSAVEDWPMPPQTPTPAPKPAGQLNEQMIFEYAHPEDQSVVRYVDPWEVDRRLRQHGGDGWGESISILQAVGASSEMLKKMPAVAAHAEAQRQKAFEELSKLSRKVFALPTVEEAGRLGWTDGMAFVLLADYLIQAAAIGAEFLPLPKSLARPAV